MKTDKTSNAEKLKAALMELAKREPQRPQSMFEAIKEQLPLIRDLKARRFTDKEILGELEAHGIEMSLGTFRQYVNRAAKAGGGTPAKTKRDSKVNVVPRAKAVLPAKAESSTAETKPKSKPSLGFESKFDDE